MLNAAAITYQTTLTPPTRSSPLTDDEQGLRSGMYHPHLFFPCTLLIPSPRASSSRWRPLFSVTNTTMTLLTKDPSLAFRRQPSRPICRSISYGGSASMGTNIKQPETPRRVLEWEAVQTLCKMLLFPSSSHHTTINSFSCAYNAHASRKLTYLNTIMKRQRRHAWPSSSCKRHHRWDLLHVPT
jgi:hypothetical protein